MSQANRRSSRDWYSVSVESVRRTLLLLLTVVALIAGAFAYQQFRHAKQAEQAQLMLDDAGALARQIEDRPDYDRTRREFFSAWEDLDAGGDAFQDERYGEAVNLLDRSIRQFRDILAVEQEDNPNQGQFLSVSGNVEYRRGERGAWKRAQPDDVLSPGDWVKTSAGGSASVRFPDGSSYTLRANTMVHLSAQTDRLGRSQQVAEMSFGWVELSTRQSRGTVRTPKAEAQVQSSSQAMVSFDRERNESRFAAYAGGMDVVADNGQTQTIGALQQVIQTGDLLSGPASLPGKPRLLFPPTDRQFSTANKEMRLTWRAVSGARGYALQVSRNRLFASTIIDNERTKTSARIGLRSEGVYYWQVAAVSSDGETRGPWSEPRSFKVRLPQRSAGDDKTPPMLLLEDVQGYGSMLIVSGRTEPGSSLELNGSAAEVKSDGTFSARLQMNTEGFAFINAAATDAAGNTTREQRRVFIDSSY
ncbi:MAG: FecR domain-containing protein [Acidobacteriota bacterium]